MLDRSSKLDDSLMDAYRSIHEIHKGHAAGESDIENAMVEVSNLLILRRCIRWLKKQPQV